MGPVAVVLDECRVDDVVLVSSKRADGDAFVAVNAKVVVDVDGASVKETMMIRTQAKNVAGDVRPVVWLPEALDVGPIGDGASWSGELEVAHLTSVIM